MQNLIQTIRQLVDQGGGHILLSNIIGKGLNFLLSFLIIKILSAESYGGAVYALNIVSFAMPLTGLGAYQGILRFGALASSQLDKRKLFFYGLKKGIVFSILLVAVFWALSFYFDQHIENGGYLIRLFSFQLISYTLFEALKSYARIHLLNKTFAGMDLLLFCVQFVLGISLGIALGGEGYLLALVISPLLASIYYYFRLKLTSDTLSENKTPEFWKYSVYTSVGNLASQLLFLIDIFLIGQLLKEPTEIAYYRAATIIPFNLSLIPMVFIHTTFVKVSQQNNSKSYLKNYLKNYYSMFVPYGIGLVVLLLWLGPYIFRFLKPEYELAIPSFQILCIGVLGAIFMRIPYGNLISAIGKAHWNSNGSVVVLMLNVVLNYFAIKQYGILGAAITTSILLWGSGFLFTFLFWRWLNQQPDDA